MARRSCGNPSKKILAGNPRHPSAAPDSPYLDLLILLSHEVLGAHWCNGHKAFQLFPTGQEKRKGIAATHGGAYQNRLLKAQLLEDFLQESNTAWGCLNSTGVWGVPIACGNRVNWDQLIARKQATKKGTLMENIQSILAVHITYQAVFPKV